MYCTSITHYMMGNMTVKLPRIRLYFSYSVLCYLTTTNATVILQNLFWVHIKLNTPQLVCYCAYVTGNCVYKCPSIVLAIMATQSSCVWLPLGTTTLHYSSLTMINILRIKKQNPKMFYIFSIVRDMST